MGWKWVIEGKSFNCATKQLTVTVKFDQYEGNDQWVSEPFGRDEDDIKWHLILDDSTWSVYLEKIGGDKYNHSFVVDVPDAPNAVERNVANLQTSGDKVKIAYSLYFNESFDIKITYPDCFIKPKCPLPSNRAVRGKFCDVKFRVGGETIGFYKERLAQKSDVFETMFLSPVTDPLKANDPIKIKDASAIAFNAFLNIVYNDESASRYRSLPRSLGNRREI